MLKRRRVLALAALVVMAAGCHRHQMPSGVVDTARMTDFLTDAYLLEGMYGVEHDHEYDSIDTKALAAYDALLRKHGLTAAQVDSSLAYYGLEPDMMAEMLERVTQRLADNNLNNINIVYEAK